MDTGFYSDQEYQAEMERIYARGDVVIKVERMESGLIYLASGTREELEEARQKTSK